MSEAIASDRGFSIKLDIFMRSHVLPQYRPEQIRWWLSLSGGKDSFAMAEGLRRWYRERGLRLNAVLFTIDQWHGEAPLAIKNQIAWASVHTVDANEITLQSTQYLPGKQAPCRSCSDVRRTLTDELIRSFKSVQQDSADVNILARGLHLTDTAISALWRHAMGRNPAEDMLRAGKARPFTHLYENVYLAKPLSYVREFESQQYADSAGFQHACCGCPACRFPSRRDIVEETIAGFLRGPLWEFDVPGIEELVSSFNPAEGVLTIKRHSEMGTEQKHSHLPRSFADAMVKAHIRRWNSVRTQIESFLDFNLDLDRFGIESLRKQPPRCRPNKVPIPRIFRDRAVKEYSDSHVMTIATLGPFWGAIGLDSDLGQKAWAIQREYFNVEIDELWSQVEQPLREYYRAQEHSRPSLPSLVQIR